MTQPNKYPLWIVKIKDYDDDIPYFFIYKICDNLFLLESADKDKNVHNPETKVFMKMNEVKEELLENEEYDLVHYNPEQSYSKLMNFLTAELMQQAEQLAQQHLAQNNQPSQSSPVLQDEDPSSEDSEEPTSE